MSIEKFREKLFRILDTSNKLKIASLAIDYETNHILLVELVTGEKFEIDVRKTNRII